MNNEQMNENTTPKTHEEPLTDGEGEGGDEVMTPEESTPDGTVPEEGTTEEDTAESRLAAFLAVLSPKDKKMLREVLARLAESERQREAEEKRKQTLHAIAEMDKSPCFTGIAARADAILALCHSVPWLAALPTCERLSAAYYIDRGMRYGEPTKEDLLHALLSDSDLQAALEMHRRAALEEGGHTLPPVLSRRGAGRAPATVKERPRTLTEASDEAKKYLRFYK